MDGGLTNPIIVTVEGPVTEDNISIQRVVWYGGTTAGHKARLDDNADNILFPFIMTDIASLNDSITQHNFPLKAHPCRGLKCSDLDSGYLLIYWTERAPTKDIRSYRIDA